MDQVHQHLQNANNADLDALVESIQINGFVTAITADAKTGNIIAGNHRYQALHALGATEIPVLWVDHWDEAGAIRYMVADNQTSRLAVMDNAALAELLNSAKRVTLFCGRGCAGARRGRRARRDDGRREHARRRGPVPERQGRRRRGSRPLPLGGCSRGVPFGNLCVPRYHLTHGVPASYGPRRGFAVGRLPVAG